eukprot:365482-Chlamydomonas_euryale.AAC.5
MWVGGEPSVGINERITSAPPSLPFTFGQTWIVLPPHSFAAEHGPTPPHLDVCAVRRDLCVRLDGLDDFGGDFRLALPNVAFSEEELSVEVARLDGVQVDLGCVGGRGGEAGQGGGGRPRGRAQRRRVVGRQLVSMVCRSIMGAVVSAAAARGRRGPLCPNRDGWSLQEDVPAQSAWMNAGMAGQMQELTDTGMDAGMGGQMQKNGRRHGWMHRQKSQRAEPGSKI